ncbi:MAG: hybrid sensor histidine kinase/response regulator, partial [Lachnospiraceae bacterium]|nr:hybrid sensor histidine kinase/response regulator [Lachnospiraceae bacterium]
MNRVRSVIAFIAVILCLAAAFFPVPVNAGVEESDTEAGLRVNTVLPYGGGYAVTGQLPDLGYMSQLYDARSGMPTSEANYILGTSDGYIWIAAYSGILRYDGTDFEKIEPSDILTNGRGLFEDSKGRIWVGTNDNGVVLLEKDKTMIRHFTEKTGLSASSIRVFAEDKKGNVFIGTTAGISYVDEDLNVHILDDARINNERILKLSTDIAGTVYGHTKSGVVFSIDSCRITDLFSGPDIGTEKITTVTADPGYPGRIYFGTASNIIYYGDFGKNRTSLKRILTGSVENIHWMTYACGRIWVSSENSVGYIDEYNRFVPVEKLPMNRSIEMMTSDYQGNMWFASSRQGIMKIISDNFLNLTAQAGLEDDVVNSTCFHNGQLYIGTDNGLFILGTDNVPVENALTEHIGSNRIRCIREDKAGNLWIATFSNDLGLVRYSPDGKIRDYTTTEGMPSNEVRCIKAASDGRILACTSNGLVIINDGRIDEVYDSGHPEIRNSVFLTVEEGENGAIYIGTDGDGMYVLENNDIRRIGISSVSDVANTDANGSSGNGSSGDGSSGNGSSGDGLTSPVVLRIKRDRERDLYWIITSNSIEFLKEGIITNISTFPYKNIFDIYINDNDQAWVLTSMGIYVVNVDELLNNNVLEQRYRLYNYANGLTSTPVVHSYSALDRKGYLYIAGQTGVSRVNINTFIDQTQDVKLGIGSIIVGNTEIQPVDKKYVIPSTKEIIRISPVVLDYFASDPVVRVF